MAMAPVGQNRSLFGTVMDTRVDLRR